MRKEKETVIILTVSFFGLIFVCQRKKDSRGAAFLEKVYYWDVNNILGVYNGIVAWEPAKVFTKK